MTDRTTEMLALADRVDATPAYKPKDLRSFRTPILYQCDNPDDHSATSVILINSAHRGLIVTALRASGGAYVAGQRDMQERAKAAQPCTAANPFQSTYDRGKFDGVMEYRRAIASLPLEAQESDGGSVLWTDERLTGLIDWAYLHATEGQSWPSRNTQSGLVASALIGPPSQADADKLKPGPSDTPTGDAVNIKLRYIFASATHVYVGKNESDPIYMQHLKTDEIGAIQAALKPEAAPAGEVVAWQWRLSGSNEWQMGRVPDWSDGVAEERPLYATPPAITEREALSALLVENDDEDQDDDCELCGGRGTVDAYTDRDESGNGRDEIGCPACTERAHSRTIRAALDGGDRQQETPKWEVGKNGWDASDEATREDI